MPSATEDQTRILSATLFHMAQYTAKALLPTYAVRRHVVCGNLPLRFFSIWM
jgi:hypothetical protein